MKRGEKFCASSWPDSVVTALPKERKSDQGNSGDQPDLINARVDEAGDRHQPQPMPTMPTTISPVQKPKPAFSPKPAPRKPQSPIVSDASPSPSISPESTTPDPSDRARGRAMRV